MAAARLTWLDRMTHAVAPRWTLDRVRSRIALDLLQRHYEGAATGRRTQGWNKSAGDANAVIGPALATLRAAARDLVRNNPYAESALTTIADHAVGWGISGRSGVARIDEAWRAWAESTDCDADGRHDLAGLQKLIMRTVVESGEVLIRRRWRRASDGLAIPLQLQVLDPDFLDTTRDTAIFPASSGGRRILQGVEFDALGRRSGYWLFPEHPGAAMTISGSSAFIPAADVLHVFRPLRPGQVRGPSWFAPVLLRSKDFDEFEDATLMKQKVAACLAVITSDVDGTGSVLGAQNEDDESQDMLAPGMIINAAPGRSVDVVQPPKVDEYDTYAKNQLRAIATGLGVTYEDLTGDYTDMPFSAARMSRLRHEARVHDWRWRILIPQFCDPAWRWFLEAVAVTQGIESRPRATWTPPPLPMVDPDKEGQANVRRVRSGQASLPEVLRELGYNPDQVFAEIAATNKTLDLLGLELDSDPRRMTQQGQRQQAATPSLGEAVPGGEEDDEDDATGERSYRH